MAFPGPREVYTSLVVPSFLLVSRRGTRSRQNVSGDTIISYLVLVNSSLSRGLKLVPAWVMAAFGAVVAVGAADDMEPTLRNFLKSVEWLRL